MEIDPLAMMTTPPAVATTRPITRPGLSSPTPSASLIVIDPVVVRASVSSLTASFQTVDSAARLHGQRSGDDVDFRIARTRLRESAPPAVIET
jgi:hypothetical protein